ncbi:aspartate kinase [Streptomyces sp. NPDC058330]|uniref:aspartate kinase n=1 Tax=Streptomyces sp. NPDC058330 TaxID=3346449 RepID=UPI0036EB5375
MGLVVQKYGGSSVADAEGIKRVARRVADTREDGHEVVVVVSAMGDTTDELIDLAQQVSPAPGGREFDALLTAGERVSTALLAMAIKDLGHRARSFTGRQAGVVTDSAHNRAHIVEVTPGRVRSALDEGVVAVVAGFQGVSANGEDVTTLGRGGSDTTAVALAAALDAEVCEIYTDVDGVFTADPRVVSKARKIDWISFEDMLELALSGSKVLLHRCVEYARRHDVPIHVRSSFSQERGTWVSNEPLRQGDRKMEQAVISGVAHDTSTAVVTVAGVPDKPQDVARLFRAMADAELTIDMVATTVSPLAPALADLSFLLPRSEAGRAMETLQELRTVVGFESLNHDADVARISLVGTGMRTAPGLAAAFVEALSAEGVDIRLVTCAGALVTAVVQQDQIDTAVRAVHTSFSLDRAEGEARVHAGTGR